MNCNKYRNTRQCSGHRFEVQVNELASKQHVWEGIIARINNQVARLRDLGAFHSSLVLGPVVLRRDYGVDGPAEGAEIVQAGLSSELGLVAVFWDTEDLHEANLADLSVKECDAIDRARPLVECGAIVRWLVARDSNNLLSELMKRVKLLS